MPKFFSKSSKKFSPFQILLLALSTVLLIAIPLYPKFPLFFIKGERVAIRLDDIIITLSFLVFLIVDWKDKFAVLRSRFALLIYFLFFALALSTLNSFFVGHDSPRLAIALLHLLRRAEYFTIFFVIKKSLDLGRNKNQHIWTILFALVLVAIVGLGQKFLSWPVVSTMNEEFSKGLLLQMSVWTRISSTFAGHYDLAVYLSLILAFLPAFLINHRKLITKLSIIALWLLAFYLLVLTASRVSFIAAFLGTMLALILCKKRLWIIPLITVNILGVLISPDLNQRLVATYQMDIHQKFPALTKFISEKFSFLKPQEVTPTPAPIAQIPTPTPTLSKKPVKTTPTPTPKTKKATSSAEFIWPREDIATSAQRSGDIRFKVEWPRAINALKKNPLLGTGPSSITLATDNDYLRILGEGGLLGFFSWILPFAYLIKKSIPIIKKKQRNENDYLIFGLLAVIAAMFLNATLIDVFEASKIAYFFWGLIALLVYLLDQKIHVSKKK